MLDIEDRPGTVILRVLRYAGWVERNDLYEMLGCAGRSREHSAHSQALHRLKLGGFVEYDVERLIYRITEAGKLELRIRLNRLEYYTRQSERNRRAQTCRRDRAA